MFTPVPADVSQPARQVDMYDKPLSPHTGSHILVGQLQCVLQSARILFPTYKPCWVLKWFKIIPWILKDYSSILNLSSFYLNPQLHFFSSPKTGHFLTINAWSSYYGFGIQHTYSSDHITTFSLMYGKTYSQQITIHCLPCGQRLSELTHVVESNKRGLTWKSKSASSIYKVDSMLSSGNVAA
jgi:hypothetical protein